MGRWEGRSWPTNPGWMREDEKRHPPVVISEPQDGVRHGSERKLKLSG